MSQENKISELLLSNSCYCSSFPLALEPKSSSILESTTLILLHLKSTFSYI